jgi:hypothetical protein
MPIIQVPTTNQSDQDLILLLLELHQASRQYLRYLNIDQLRVAEAYKRLTEATHAVTLHLERQLDEETGDA